MTNNDLINAALAVADLFRDGDTPEDPDIRWLVREADNYRQNGTTAHSHAEVTGLQDCVLCAVRQLTEGIPRAHVFQAPGETVSGVVLKVGTVPSIFGPGDPNPYVDIWTGTERVRVIGYGLSLSEGIRKAEITVGDRVQVTLTGVKTVKSGRFKGKDYKTYDVRVTRGHH